MPEIRHNIATGEWVIIATERAKRPEQFVQAKREKVSDRPALDPQCPFCPGNEELELERLRLPAEGDWQLRVLRNKYPALNESLSLTRHSDQTHHVISGFGYHEVIVESRLHNTCPALQSPAEVERALSAFQARGRALRADQRVAQMIYFKNHGAGAGTSLVHPHTQLVALPVVPYGIRSRVEVARRYYDDEGACVICQMREAESREGARIVLETEWFCVFVPYAAFSPFHLWLVPRAHRADFGDVPQAELHDLSIALRGILRRLYVGLNDPDYNYVIRSAPERESPYLHWYIAIVPRVTHTAGFEMGSGMFINTSLPEESAAFLRAVDDR